MAETTQFLINHGLPLVFVAVFLEQMGLPLPALPWLMAAGALSATGQFSLFLGLTVTVIACLVADAFWFYLGRYRGNQVLGLLCRTPASDAPRTYLRGTGYEACWWLNSCPV